MSVAEPFGRWLQRRREALDLTRDELASRVGCAEVTIRKIERGERRPSKQIADLIAGQLDLTPAEREGFIRRARAADGLAEAPAPAAPVAPPPSLPIPATPLIGRERDLAVLRGRLLSADVRLLTIVGMPGVGKTRVALHAAVDLSDAFADGVRFVGLAALADPRALPEAIGEALGLAEPAQQLTDRQVIEQLRGRQLLLVLDNLEQLLDGVGFIAELLAAAPLVKVLATSRVVLRLSGEHAYHIAPLALPAAPGGGAGELGPIAEAPAVQLFVQRARATQADFALTLANAAAVAEICARLDGLPLALELAATWARVLSVEEIAQETARGLDILSAGLRDVPARQRSLRAVLDHSWALLGPDERATLRRLSALPGAFGRAAAEAVGGASLRTLASLIDHSLLGRDAPGRYDMHPLVRQYAAEQLGASGEAPAARAALVAYALELAEEAARQIDRGDQAAWIARLEREHDTVRAGMAAASADPAAALRLAVALGPFWGLRGYFREGAAYVERALELHAGSPPSEPIVWATAHAGMLRCGLGDFAGAGGFLARAEAMARALGDRRLLARLLLHLIGYEADGGFARTRAWLDEAIATFRALGDRRGLAIALSQLANLKDVADGDALGAHAAFREVVVLLREQGERLATAGLLKRLGDMSMAMGDFAAARTSHRESLALARELGSRIDEGWILGAMSQVAGYCDDHVEEEALAAAALGLCDQTGDLGGRAWATVRLAWAAWRAGRLELAEERFRAAGRLYGAMSHANPSRGWVPSGLGHIAWDRGDFAGAAALLDESLGLFRGAHFVSDLIFGLNAAGHLAAARGELGPAQAALAEALALAERRHDRWAAASALEGLAEQRARAGRADLAARLLGAAAVMREASGAPAWRLYRDAPARALAVAAAELGPDGLATALAAGRALDIAAALGLARAG